MLSKKDFAKRLLRNLLFAVLLIGLSLLGGMAGYHYLEGLPWIDAFLNASMILSGMGPIHNPQTTGGKIFAGIYAIFSGFAVLGVAAVVFAPVIHRAFHKLHIADTDKDPRT